MTTPSETAGGLREELGQDTAHLRDTLKQRARTEADTRKEAAVGLAGPASKALGAAADDLRANPEAPDWMASGLQQVARQIDRIAGDLNGRSVDDLTRDAARFARENPGTFLAASAAVGFAAARLLRAGAEHKQHGRNELGGSGYGTVQTAQGDTPGWPADENVRPTGAGEGFTPAYSPEGGTIR